MTQTRGNGYGTQRAVVRELTSLMESGGEESRGEEEALVCGECQEDEDDRTGTITCDICCDDKPAEDFRGKLAAGCAHLRQMCDGCAVRHIRAEVNGKGNTTQIRCPHAGCGAALSHSDVQRHASANDFEQYDGLLIKQ